MANIQILYQGADILALLVGGQASYRINAIYMEFVKNGTVFTPPGSIDPASSNYFTGLIANPSASSDFLRIPISLTPAWNSSNSDDYNNNVVRFSAQTSDGVGMRQQINSNGLSFTTGDLIVGGALVATPGSDVTDDLVFARFYYTQVNQVQKYAGLQVGVTIPLQFN